MTSIGKDILMIKRDTVMAGMEKAILVIKRKMILKMRVNTKKTSSKNIVIMWIISKVNRREKRDQKIKGIINPKKMASLCRLQKTSTKSI